MAEQIRDFLAATTLAASASAIATTITVADASVFPSSGNFDIRIDSEIMTVSAVAGSVFTVARAKGTPATTAATHSIGADVRQVLTKRQLDVLLTTLPSTTQSGTNYTLALADAGTAVEGTNASPTTFVVPPNSSVAFLTGTVIEIYQAAGQITVSAGSGVTLRAPNGQKTASLYSTLSIRQRSADEWVISGSATT